jgi:hypothetical protein
MYHRYFFGLDLGQAEDHSALALLERTPAPDPGGLHATRWHFVCRHLERWALGTAYPAVITRIQKLVRADRLRGATLVVDQTGVGRAVVDLLRAARLPVELTPITITGGHNINWAQDNSVHVPKKELVGCLQVLLQARRLKIAGRLPEAKLLERELLNFKVKITPAAHETFGAWREGEHDDLVLAVALAAWQGQRDPGPCSRPFVLSPGVQFPRPYS